LAEVNHPVLRSLRAGEIAEAARVRLAAELAAQSRSRRGAAADRQEAARRYQALTTPSRPRPTGARPASTQLEKVAELFLAALAAGGDSARRPSVYVHQALAAQGSDISLNTVRGQIHRARVKGLIPLVRG
jgi:pantothenate synthetase